LPEVVGAIAHLFLTERQYRHIHTRKKSRLTRRRACGDSFFRFFEFPKSKKSRRKRRGGGYSDRTCLFHHIQHLYVHWLYPVILSIL
jgi:hypothetical protein